MEINTTHDNYVIRYSLTMLAIVQADIMFKMDLNIILIPSMLKWYR